MKVLFLFNGYRKPDDRTRINLVKKLYRYCNLIIYGPKENDKKYSPFKYNESLNILKEFNPDVILFSLYNPTCINWIPSYIYKSYIPRVIIEEDHYTENGKYDFEKKVLKRYINFDLVIRRHYYKERQNINSVWLPFSASTNEFFNDENIERKNIIGFAGSYRNEYYNIRRNAINTLSKEKLIENHKYVSNYPLFLRSFKGCLTCAGGEIHTPMAKAFEIILSGTPLLTNFMYNDKILFGSNKCYFEYKDDCSDIIDQAKIILSDADQVKEITDNAMKVVKEKHTDNCRVKELYNILKSITSNKEIPRIWGQ